MATMLKASVSARTDREAMKPLKELEAILRDEDLCEDSKVSQAIELALRVNRDGTSALVSFEMRQEKRKITFDAGFADDGEIRFGASLEITF